MAKVRNKSPWVFSQTSLPVDGQYVLVDYVTKDGKTLYAIGHMNYRDGWYLHYGMRLPEGCMVIAWMPIPDNLPF